MYGSFNLCNFYVFVLRINSGLLARDMSPVNLELETVTSSIMSGQEEILKSKPEPMSGRNLIIGFLFIFSASCSLTASSVVQKFVCPSLNFWSMMLIRSLLQLAITSVIMVVKKIHWINKNESKWLILNQGLIGGLSLLGIFVAVKNVPLGNCSAIFFCVPVATFIFAACFLRERFGIYRALISVFMLSGVAIITRPSFIFSPDPPEFATNITIGNASIGNSTTFDASSSSTTIGYCAAICTMALQAILSILMRQCKAVALPLLMFWLGFGIFLVGLGGMGISYVIAVFGEDSVPMVDLFDLSLFEVICAIVMAAFGMSGYLLFILAIRRIGPSKTNVFRSFEVILNYLLQIFVEKIAFHSPDIAGIVLLVIAVFAIGFEQEVLAKKIHQYL